MNYTTIMNADWTQSWELRVFGLQCGNAEMVKARNIAELHGQCINGFKKLTELNYSGPTRR